MVVDLTLICHGPTRATRAAAFPRDEPLEPGAAEAIRALRPRLGRTTRAWTSPALRARETAAALGLAAGVEPLLREGDAGRWAGRQVSAVAAAEPAAFAAWLADPAAAPHGGEPLGDLLARVAGWIEARRDEPGRGVAVTHASVVRAAVLHVLGAPPAAFGRIAVAPLGLVRLRGDGRRWTLRAGELGPGEMG